MKHRMLWRLAIAAGLVLAPGSLLHTTRVEMAHAKTARPHLWRVNIGVGFFYSGLVVNKFAPDTLKIHAGDSVRWDNISVGRPQTVTFGPILNTPPLFTSAGGAEANPRIVQPQGGKVVGSSAITVYSSGAIARGIPGLQPGYTFTFPEVGKYFYRSLFHPLSLGEIDVLPAGAPVSSDPPDTGASYYDALRSADKVIASITPSERDGGASGGNSTTILIGGGDANVSTTKFSPMGLTVKVGATVTWAINEESGDPHDLYFGPLGLAAPTYTRMAPDGGLMVNPVYARISLPSGTTVTTATTKLATVWNSGILYGSSVQYPSPTPSKYSLTFAVPGRFIFVDPFYANVVGTLVVIP